MALFCSGDMRCPKHHNPSYLCSFCCGYCCVVGNYFLQGRGQMAENCSEVWWDSDWLFTHSGSDSSSEFPYNRSFWDFAILWWNQLLYW